MNGKRNLGKNKRNLYNFAACSILIIVVDRNAIKIWSIGKKNNAKLIVAIILNIISRLNTIIANPELCPEVLITLIFIIFLPMDCPVRLICTACQIKNRKIGHKIYQNI